MFRRLSLSEEIGLAIFKGYLRFRKDFEDRWRWFCEASIERREPGVTISLMESLFHSASAVGPVKE